MVGWIHVLLLQVILLASGDLHFREVNGFSLSTSPSSEDGYNITVCPATTVTLTCTASNQALMTWRANTELVHSFIASDVENENTRVVQKGHYTVSLSVENVTGSFADFTSTLEVNVDNINNGTDIVCQLFSDEKHLIIYKKGNASKPNNVSLKFTYGQTDYSIVVSWKRRDDEVVDEYRILTNTTNQSITTNTTTVVLEGEYNIPLQIRVWAINCAGPSTQVTEEVIVAGCGQPSPPVNGIVGGWTSSQVGAQVAYSCDTDLVLVGERVAHCSPSLQWIPSSDDVMCSLPQPSGSTSSTITAVSFSPGTVPSSSPTSQDNQTTDDSGAIVAAVVVPLFIVGVFVFVIISLFIFIYYRRLKKRKIHIGGQENWYDGQEMLMRPGSSTGTITHSLSPHSPLPSSSDPPSIPAPVYSMAQRPEETSSYSETQGAADNGASSTPMYSETNTSARRLVMSYETHGLAKTTGEGTNNNTSSPSDHPREKYAELFFNNSRSSCSRSSGGRKHLNPLPSSLEPPIQYAEINARPPKPTTPEPYSQAVASDKHPLDQAITIDMVIQQLGSLTPHWWAVGGAGGLPRSTLKEISAHFKGDERESFAEVINQIFIPNTTTWTMLAGVCERAGFTDLTEALLNSYTTGVLPVQIEDKFDSALPPSQPAPPVPPRVGGGDVQEDIPPSLPPPLAPEDIMASPPPHLNSETPIPPPRPPKSGKVPAVPPRC